MPLRSLMLAAMLALALALALAKPVHAGDRQSPAELDLLLEQMMTPQAWLGGRVTEADVELLFAYLKASLVAASQGRELPVPDQLSRRAEAIGRDLQAHGMLTGLLLLHALEARARQAIREIRPDVPPIERP